MERGERGEVIIEYELLKSGIDKNYNLQDSNVWYGLEQKLGPKLCSAQKFGVYEEAHKYADYLFDNASPHILKLVGITKHGDSGGIVFVERVLPFQDWIDRKYRIGMWRRKDGVVLGVGEPMKSIFQQLLIGLKYLHNNLKNAHNNLGTGVYVTPDWRRVMLGNFFLADKMNLSSKKGDFTAFKAIFESAVQTINPGGSFTSDNVKTKVLEVKLFILMMEKALATNESFIACCKFLYNPFILWGPNIKRLFYAGYVYAVKLVDNKPLRLDMVDHFEKGWKKRIKAKTVLDDAIKYQYNPLYDYRFGPVVLIRNFDFHCPIFVENVFDIADAVFPEALGASVHSLLFGSFGYTPLNPLFDPNKVGSKEPPKYARDFILQGLLPVVEYQYV